MAKQTKVPAPETPVAAPVAAPATHHAGLALASLPKNIAARGATAGVPCPPALAGAVLVQASNAKPPRAPHVALWVQAAQAQLSAAGGRATGSQLCAPVALPVPEATAAQFGMVPAEGKPGHYTLACPGHVLAYVLGTQFSKA